MINILRSYGYVDGQYVEKKPQYPTYSVSKEQYNIITKFSIYIPNIKKAEDTLKEMQLIIDERQKLYDTANNYENSNVATKYLKSFLFDKKETEGKIRELENQITNFSNKLEKNGIEYTYQEGAIEKLEKIKHQRENSKDKMMDLVENNIEFIHIIQDSPKNINFNYEDKIITINRDTFLKNIESDEVYINKDLNFERRESELKNSPNDLWTELAEAIYPEHTDIKKMAQKNNGPKQEEAKWKARFLRKDSGYISDESLNIKSGGIY